MRETYIMHHSADHQHHQHERGWSPGGPRRRWLEPFLLVLLAGGPAHGYSLLGRLNGLGVAPEDVDVGQLYRTLRELELAGLVRSNWETPAAGAARRGYALTDAGLAVLDDWALVMRERARLVAEFLKGYEESGRVAGQTDTTKEV
jgi:PadR family transcriptional regulator PadR